MKRKFENIHPNMVTATNMPKKSEYREKPVRIPDFATDVAGVSLLIFLFVGLAGWGISRDAWTGLGMGSAAAAVVVLLRAWLILDRVRPDLHEVKWQNLSDFLTEEDDEDIDENPDMVYIAFDDIQFAFGQPRPGEFANYIGHVIKDQLDEGKPFYDQITLSQRTAESRGWSRDMHKTMVRLFLEHDLVYRGRNRTPELTEKGIGVFSDYLHWSVAPPLNRQ